jgi:hypothetical protein
VYIILYRVEVCLLKRCLEVYPKYRPIKQTNSVRNFKCGGKNGSTIGEIIIQFNLAPPTIEKDARVKVGNEQKKSISLIGCSGEIFIGPHTTVMRNRIVYLTVSPVAKKNKRIITILVGEDAANSRMLSLE